MAQTVKPYRRDPAGPSSSHDEKHIPHPTNGFPGGYGIATPAPYTTSATSEGHLTTAFAVLATMWAYERVFAMTFVLNFSDQGPGPTLLLLAFTASGLLYLTPFARTWPHDRAVLDIAFAALVMSTILAHSLPPGWSLFFALAALTSATPLLATVIARQDRNVVYGLALGMLMHMAARAWNEGLPLAASPTGRVFMLVLLGIGITVWLTTERRFFPKRLGRPEGYERPRLGLIMTLLVYEAALFAQPAGVARWAGASVLSITFASAGGLAVGAALNLLPPLPAWLRWTPVLFFTSGVTWITFGAGQAAVATFIAQAGAMRLAARANSIPPRAHIVRIGFRTGMVQLGAILIVFLHAAGPSWAFLPGPILPALTHNLTAFWLFVLASFVAAVATPGLVADDQEVPG